MCSKCKPLTSSEQVTTPSARVIYCSGSIKHESPRISKPPTPDLI